MIRFRSPLTDPAKRFGPRVVSWPLLVVFALLSVVPVSGLLMSSDAAAQEQKREQVRQQSRAGQGGEVNQRADFWRIVREGDSGYSAVRSPGANVLIQNGGQNWRALRNGPFKTYGAWMLAATALVIVLLLMAFGTLKLENGPSGMTIPRWSAFYRFLHWYTAILFLVLMVTGLSLLYGRYVLIPVIGKDAFAAFADLAKRFHDYLGPFFAAGLALELILWMRHNFPKAHDFRWFAQGGGLLKGKHPEAGRMNGGEKLWYWVLFVFGLAAVISGLMMNFPNLGWTRGQMQIANLVHVGSGFVLMCFAMGHIYAGVSTRGAVQGMTTGRVDVEWARQHHNLWYHEMMDQGVEPRPADAPAADERPNTPSSAAT